MVLLVDCITLDCADARSLAAFWATALGYQTIVEQENDWFVLRSASGTGPLLGFQQVPEPKVVKNRMHLDLKSAGASMAAEVTRLEQMGATAVRLVTNAPGEIHTVMQDPEGNEFCVVGP